MSLTYAASGCAWAAQSVQYNIHSLTTTNILVDAVTDLAGMENTLHIKATAEAIGSGDFAFNAPAAYYCYYYDHLIGTTGTEAKGWYLPSIGQLNILYMNRAYIHSSITTLTGIASPMQDGADLMSSTDYGSIYVWGLLSGGAIGNYIVKYYPGTRYRARAVCDF